MTVIPADLRYTDKHEWLAAPQPSGAVRVGITAFAQDALGDIVYVDLPEVGTAVTAGEAFGEVESTKSASEIYSPVTGTVVARNERLAPNPELINAEPYGAGWLIEIEPADGSDGADLLDAEGYAALIERG
jgi:glycine cleavage system H protein